ncbi:right-handed parallel beta-helix repeat-containing protein [Clostridium bowmanii]|uniref:right-handed parallel beta-helix repeat-containing protein n=1 Tax=Clostridium bowmanii TaxID=132925 RepID=UPI001C0DB871|nr:right-handed parallel beta-helix repeat-containing protein [Clostridium bowmanii]MBU3191231.1 right-handed parallel beta-helix repeat-containing protein [Clostridium bowmanii]MCA1075679.1 right-handed parallel beta-helix repeat-containing protein [Clostridium bowmanii]
MLKRSSVKLSLVMISIMLFTSTNVNAATNYNNRISRVTKSTNSTSRITKSNNSTAPVTSTISYNNSINIKDFGAHSIDEVGYSKFDSSVAINKAIQAAKTSGSTSVDFGSGRYYAKDITLESNMTYFSSTNSAELISSPDIKVWESILTAENKTQIVLKNLKLNGNWDVVAGDDMSGSPLVAFTKSDHITITDCYLYHNKYLAILLQFNCDYITIKNNTIYDTDCGILTAHDASNNLTIDNNLIYGDKYQYSEPIAIFNTNAKGLAHDITITNNTLHDKKYASGILVMNATKTLIKGNTIYNTDQGICIGMSRDLEDITNAVSNKVTITDNKINNCISGGIIAELSNSLISKNIISDIIGSGITLTSRGDGLSSSNCIIINNTLTNINSKLGQQEPALRLQNSLNCTIDKNTVSDNRTKAMHYFVIQVQGSACNNNIIQNNTNLGTTNKDGYQIYVQDANSTIVRNNKATFLDQGAKKDNTSITSTIFTNMLTAKR